MNPDLINALKGEVPRILNRMLAAVPGLLQRKRFDIPAVVRENVALLKMQVNSARMFLADRIEAGGKQSFLGREEVMSEYERWCGQNGYKSLDLSVAKE